MAKKTTITRTDGKKAAHATTRTYPTWASAGYDKQQSFSRPNVPKFGIHDKLQPVKTAEATPKKTTSTSKKTSTKTSTNRYDSNGKDNNPKAYGGSRLVSIKEDTPKEKRQRKRAVRKAKKRLGW